MRPHDTLIDSHLHGSVSLSVFLYSMELTYPQVGDGLVPWRVYMHLDPWLFLVPLVGGR